jgi:hypothetical protein
VNVAQPQLPLDHMLNRVSDALNSEV